jgi:hypothetical protein
MTRTGKRWLPLSLLSVVAALAGLLAVVSIAHGAVQSLGVGSATVAPGGQATVDVTAAATAPGIGAWTVDVAYNAALVSFVSCESHPAGFCNNIAAENKVRFTGASAAGVSGNVDLGSITFRAGDDEGTAGLDVTVVTLTDPTAAPLTVTPTDGAITIAQPTPTPTPVPATPTPTPAPATPTPTPAPATPTPVVTPAAIPATGGLAGDGGSTVLYVLAALGAAIIAAGAWAVTRMRREAI